MTELSNDLCCFFKNNFKIFSIDKIQFFKQLMVGMERRAIVPHGNTSDDYNNVKFIERLLIHLAIYIMENKGKRGQFL